MTPNDSEMDVLLRRYAKVADGVKSTDHLDADELNAFAEGSLPSAARSHYVSHLADCDDCRRAVTELSAAAVPVEQIGVTASHPGFTESWWQRAGTFFAPSRLRYAAFAVVLVAVGGIGFAIWRNSANRPPNLAAQNNRTYAEDKRTISQPQEPAANAVAPERSSAVAKAIPQPTPAPFLDQKQPETTAVSPPPPAKPADAVARNETAPPSVTGRGAELAANAGSPSYAPAPPVETERADTRGREQQNLRLIHGSQRAESVEKYKSMDDRVRAGDAAKVRDEDRARTGSDQPGAKEEKDEGGAMRKRSAQRTATLASRSAGERQEEPKSDKAAPPEEADTRSVGGRKFQRQGNAWVDVKLKSSMSIKAIARGSEDFEKLDSALRSIAQQFRGPVVVVWKGKAYRIQ